MHAGIGTTALHQYVVAIHRPGVLERRLHHDLAVAAAAQLGVREDVLQDAVSPTATQEIGRRDQHAGGANTLAIVGDEDMQAGLDEGFLPEALGALARLGGGAHLRHGKQREQRRQIGGAREAGDEERSTNPRARSMYSR